MGADSAVPGSFRRRNTPARRSRRGGTSFWRRWSRWRRGRGWWSIVDATIIAAPPSTKNKSKARDPEMHQTRKGNQWHFGMKAPIGVDAASGVVHTLSGSEVVPLLKSTPGLRPIAIFDEIRRRHPEIGAGIRRTLERRIRTWRALNGAEQDIIFRQEHPPGRLGLSDFTDMGDRGVSIPTGQARGLKAHGAPLDHRLYHFRLAFSGWEHVHVVLVGLQPTDLIRGGESFVALPRGCRTRYGRSAARRCSIAATAVGRLPQSRRRHAAGSDAPLRGAVRAWSLPRRKPGAWNRRATIATWRTRTARSKARTAISSRRSRMRCCCAARAISPRSLPIAASSHGSGPRTGSEIVGRRNARNAKRLDLERSVLQALPARRTTDYEETIVTVTSSSGFRLKKVFYSVPSQLIGHRLRMRLGACPRAARSADPWDDRLECFLGAMALMTLRRGRPHPSGKRGHIVDYRHVIHALRRKPMALVNPGLRRMLTFTVPPRATLAPWRPHPRAGQDSGRRR